MRKKRKKHLIECKWNQQILHQIEHFHPDGSRSPRLECSCIYIFEANNLQCDWMGDANTSTFSPPYSFLWISLTCTHCLINECSSELHNQIVGFLHSNDEFRCIAWRKSIALWILWLSILKPIKIKRKKNEKKKHLNSLVKV